MSSTEEQNFDARMDEVELLKNAMNGTRLLNASVVKLLWYATLYAHQEDEETYNKIQNGKLWKYESFGNIGLIFYQLKYWQDVKCRENEQYILFHKSAGELREEFPWISERSIMKYLKLLSSIGVIIREQGKFRSNTMKYKYRINFEHPVVMAAYFYEGLQKLVEAEKARHSKKMDGYSIFASCEPEEVLKHIPNERAKEAIRNSRLTGKNSAVKELHGGHEGASYPYGRSFTPAMKELTCPTETILILHLYFTKPNELSEDSSHGEEENSMEEEESGSGSASPTQTSKFSRGERGEAASPQQKSDLEQQALDKLNSMSEQKRNEIKNLKVGKWRNTRKGHYRNHKLRQAANDWLEKLDQASRDLVIEFQEEAYSSGGMRNKEFSYNCSAVDAYELASNFLQFVMTKQPEQEGEQGQQENLTQEEEPKQNTTLDFRPPSEAEEEAALQEQADMFG